MLLIITAVSASVMLLFHFCFYRFFPLEPNPFGWKTIIRNDAFELTFVCIDPFFFGVHFQKALRLCSTTNLRKLHMPLQQQKKMFNLNHGKKGEKRRKLVISPEICHSLWSIYGTFSWSYPFWWKQVMKQENCESQFVIFFSNSP